MKFLFSFLLSISFQLSFAQTTNDWVLFHAENGVSFYKLEADCQPTNIPNQIGILIKIVNKNKQEITATWDLRLWYDNKEFTSNIADKENQLTVVIPKNEEILGNCDTPFGNLYILKRFTTFNNSATLTDFKFDNIRITINK
ncbi:hypothetical protein DNU06_14005 [Putridiphycobacter roseus]|uniref:Uncharacterized protein n=1 Tax=Putridiphycobacter roseus TaxID=2219161 RepID=A0A2W1NNQ5_9FLAO|nr:hypothetical protein [Putridiphycobacter roseus]PZE16238.1 hypothetical protein DNU06_14005 [Putridiphycobacter roseus]